MSVPKNIVTDSLHQATIERLGLPHSYAIEDYEAQNTAAHELGSSIDSLFDFITGSAGSQIAEILVWVVIAGLIFLLVSMGQPYYRRYKSMQDVVIKGEGEEFVTEESLIEAVAGYEEQGDWAVALRLRYVLMLRSLESQKKIEIAPAKTSRQYSREIEDKAVRSRFRDVTATFNECVFGTSELTAPLYIELVEQMHGVTTS